MSYVSLPGCRNWIMRPVLAGHIRMHELYVPGLITLEMLADLNEALDIESENSYRSINKG